MPVALSVGIQIVDKGVVMLSIEEANDILVDISPCRIIHSVDEIDMDKYPGNGLQRLVDTGCSFYSSIYRPRVEHNMRWARQEDYIFMNPYYDMPQWEHVCTLAHELGHALDYRRTHPARPILKGRGSRYREEVASIGLEIAFATCLV